MKTATLKEGIDYRVAGRLFARGVPQFVDDELGAYLSRVPQFDVAGNRTSPEAAPHGQTGQAEPSDEPEQPAAVGASEGQDGQPPEAAQPSKKRKR